MPNTGDLKRGLRVQIEGDRFTVLDVKSQSPSARGAATLVKTKMRNIRTGQQVDKTFKSGDQIHLAHAAARDELRDLVALEEFLRSIADTLVELWNAGLSTTDLAPQNVLVGRSAAGWRAILVDLDDVRIVDRISTAQVRENLAQLGHLPPSISSTTRLRFWRYFLAAGGGALLQGNRGTLEPRRRLAEIADRITRLAREKTHRLNARGLLEHRFSGWGLDAEGRPLR